MSQTVFVGEEAYINCASEGTPSPEVNFFNRNLTRVQALSSRFLQFPNDTIVVQNAQLSDTGDYLCEASNEVGHSRVWFTLTVRLDAGQSMCTFVKKSKESLRTCIMKMFHEAFSRLLTERTVHVCP